MSVKITQFEAENIKRIKAAALTPGENGLTVIGGRNNQGKTSALDAIAWALGGDRFRPSQPQREDSVLPPHLKLRLSNGIVVERTGKNSDLKVTDETGRRAGQQLLNSFVEQLALNMPKFMAANNREKADTLLRVIGLEDQIRELERETVEKYNQRLTIGRIADQKRKYAKELPEYPDAPKEAVSAFELIQRQQDILARNGENARKRTRVSQLKDEAALCAQTVEMLTEQLNEATKRRNQALLDLETAQRDALDLYDEATDEIEESLKGIEETNRKVRVNQDKARAEEEAKSYTEQYDTLTAGIEALRKQKTDLLEGAKLPLPGLGVENGELTYNGHPWDCMSGSDQLKISAAIVRALKPECGFVLVDKLEQMDIDTLREFGAWAEREGLQIISTRVSTGGECSIIIEDGYSVEPEAKEAVPMWTEDF